MNKVLIVLFLSNIAFAEPKFYYLDIVKVTDKESFYYNCQGEVDSVSNDEYFVSGLCETVNQTFKSNQLKLVRRRK